MNHNKTENLSIGVALGGGMALGFAHIGVLKALEDNDINVSYISGVSVGAIIASLYALGISFMDIEQESERLNWLNVSSIRPSKMGFTSNLAIRKVLESYIGKANIEDANIPLAIVATDIASSEKVVLKSGSIVSAVLASSCLPGLFSPIEMNGYVLVDGGICENVPVSPLKDFGADIKIGVNLLRYRKYKKPKNVVEVLANSFDIINHRITSRPKASEVDFLIEPDLGDFYMSDFKKWKEISDCGYKETLKYIKSIKEMQKAPPKETFWGNVKNLFNK